MPAAVASSEVRGAGAMRTCSHITNIRASPNVRTCPADSVRGFAYSANMARRGIPKGPIRWFLREWMETAGLSGRGSQTRMRELTGWSPATMSQLYNGTQDYSPKVLEEAANALNIEPFELLIPPERAMALRQLRKAAAEIVQAVPAAPARDTGTHG